MSIKPQQLLALQTSKEQVAAFPYLAKRLRKAKLSKSAEEYQSPLAENFSASGEGRVAETAGGSLVKGASEGAPRFKEMFATFDGTVFKPEDETAFEKGRRYRLLIDKGNPTFSHIKNRAFRRILAYAVPLGISDLAEQHEHYLDGTPKK